MRTETFTSHGATATVRSRNRRTSITEAQYMQALRAALPEIVEYEREMYQHTAPVLDLTRMDQWKPEERQRYEDYATKVSAVSAHNQTGAAYHQAANVLVPLLARITSITGGVLHINGNGRLDDASVVQGLYQFLDDDPDDGFWLDLAKAIDKVDAPLTPVEMKPPEALTQAESANPLSAAPDSAPSSV